jgi:hypothetical protein
VADRLPSIDPTKSPGSRFAPAAAAEIAVIAKSSVTKTDVGLGAVNNTADANKPVSGPQATALGVKQDLEDRGQPDGYAPLNGLGKLDPQFVDLSKVFVDLGYAQSELAHGSYGGFETEAKIREVLAGIKASGAKRVRAAGWWSIIEPVDEGGYIWTGLDQFLTLTKEYSLEPLLAVTEPAPTGAAIADYGELCGAIAARYGPSGTGGRANLLRDFELWNEINHRSFAAPFNVGSQFGPITYVALLNAAVPAIRAANPDAFIVSAGLMSTADFAPNDISPSTYLQGIYDNGGHGLFDAVGFHWYSGAADFSGWQEPSTTQTFYLELIECRDIMVAEGDERLQIWVTEMGFDRTGPVADPNVRAEWLIEQIGLLVDLPWVGPIFIYEYKDTDVSTTFGVVDTALVEQQPIHDAVSNINAVSPKVADNSVSGGQLALAAGGGTAGYIHIDADGTLAVQTPAGGGGGGAATPYGPVALPAMTPDSVNTITHGLHTTNVDPIIRRSALVTGLTSSTPGEIVTDILVRVIDADTVTVEPSVGTAAGEFLLTVNPFTAPTDVTGPGAAVLSNPARSTTTADLVLTGGSDAGIGLGGAWIYRGPSGGSRSKITTLNRGVDTYQDTGLTPGTTYDYSAKRFDLLGNPGGESNVVPVSTLPPTFPPVFDAAANSAIVSLQSDTLAIGWNHAVGAGANMGAIVAVVNTNLNSRSFVPQGTPTASVGGVGLTFLGTVRMNNNGNLGWVSVWAGTGIVANGTRAVATSMNNTGQQNGNAQGVSFSFSGVGSFGALQSLYGNDGSPSVPVSSATDQLVWGLIANWYLETYDSPTFNSRKTGSNPTYVAGERAGAASAPIAAAQAAVREWAAVAVPVLHP